MNREAFESEIVKIYWNVNPVRLLEKDAAANYLSSEMQDNFTLFSLGWQAAIAYERSEKSRAQQEPSKDMHEAITLLSAVFDAWENGTDCYDDFDGVSGSFIGKAFNLDDEIFKRCCDLLNRVNPPRNVSQSKQSEQEPYAYDVPTEDGTELAYAGYYGKYKNKLPEGAIPLYLKSQAQQSSQWISVEDRLPEMETPVVALVGKNVYALARVDYDEGWLWAICGCDLSDIRDYEADDDYQPTYWMPLAIPPAPEGGDK